GVALGYSAMMTVWVIPHLVWCLHGTGISLNDILQAARRPMIAGMISAGCAFLVQFVGPLVMSPLTRLALGSAVLFGVHFVMLVYCMGEKTFYLNLLRDSFARRSGIMESNSASS